LFKLVANAIPQVQSEVPAEADFGSDVTSEELVSVGQTLFDGAGGCTACHAESPGARAPNLLTDYRGQGTIGARCGTRIPEMACKDYLHTALADPTGHLVDEYPPIMPSAARTMDGQQVWALVAYLESNGGEVTVTGADIQADMVAAPEGSGAGAPAGGASGPAVAGEDPVQILQSLCVNCHQVGGQGVALGPPLDGIGGRLGADQIRTGILDPAASLAVGFETMAGIMPPTFGSQLTAAQLEAVVRHLSGLQ
jgi:mono/diheme cytochrome c family protein